MINTIKKLILESFNNDTKITFHLGEGDRYEFVYYDGEPTSVKIDLEIDKNPILSISGEHAKIVIDGLAETLISELYLRIKAMKMKEKKQEFVFETEFEIANRFAEDFMKKR